MKVLTTDTLSGSHFPSPEAIRAVEEADLVLVGADSHRASFDSLRFCVRHLRPAVDAGTAVYKVSGANMEAAEVAEGDDARERCRRECPNLWRAR